MKTGIHEWPEYIAEIFRVTAPGGHTQFTEISMEFISNNNALGNDAALKVIQNALQKYAFIHHLDLQVGSKLTDMVRRAGFHSVEEKVVDVPCGVWPSG
jgi:ubiquinone/menaquinone biosynthesis C-methylase UbiE